MESEIQEYLRSPYQLSPPIKPLSDDEVKLEIAKLNPKKSPGHDLITDKIIKELPMKSITLLTSIFNAVLRIGHYPKQWNMSHIIVINKPGKPSHEISSYRPISLLPVFSKTFEKLLLKRIEPILEETNLIPDHQFGLRKQHSTIHQIHRLVDHIRKDLEDKQYCSAVFLDIKQAFDKV